MEKDNGQYIALDAMREIIGRWPRYDDGGFVMVGDRVLTTDGEITVHAVYIDSFGAYVEDGKFSRYYIGGDFHAKRAVEQQI